MHFSMENTICHMHIPVLKIGGLLEDEAIKLNRHFKPIFHSGTKNVRRLARVSKSGSIGPITGAWWQGKNNTDRNAMEDYSCDRHPAQTKPVVLLVYWTAEIQENLLLGHCLKILRGQLVCPAYKCRCNNITTHANCVIFRCYHMTTNGNNCNATNPWSLLSELLPKTCMISSFHSSFQSSYLHAY